MSLATALAASSVLAFVVAGASIAALLRSDWATRALDRPNERSLHASAVPRVGGLGMLAGLVAGATPLATTLDAPLAWALASYAALALVSWLDDVRGLPAAPRLVAHLAVAAAWIATLEPTPACWVPCALAAAWSANLYNFMDGSDGMAGGMTAIGFGVLAAGFALSGLDAAAGVAAATAAAAIGFLRFNFPRALTFLGDSGSIPIGFLAAALALYGWRAGAWGLAFPLTVFLPFWFDASVTLARRTLRGDRPWRAHREHFYQKAVRSGLGHRGTAYRAWALELACGAAALASLRVDELSQALILGAGILLAVLVATAIELRARATEP